MDVNGTLTHSLVLNDITKRYGQGPAVLSDLSYSFNPGSATGLIGPNGSGKTTLLRLLSVSSFPTGGSIMYGDLDVNRSPYKYLGYVGIVHDVASLPQYMTAVELLEYVVRGRSKWTAHSDGDIDNLLNTLYLDDRRNNLIGTYSSGMLKKTQIAAALIANPRVLLLDEPFRGLDTESLRAAIDLLQTFKANGAVTVVSSHRRDVLDELCEEFLSLESTPPVTEPE
ncbi:MAG: ABC transporter ATP-binding protein [Rhodothermaceae bacterium]|nr:ABC transporter ATP-binding protein [Rhodothermaceae bacterium]